jgi:restriction system protein
MRSPGEMSPAVLLGHPSRQPVPLLPALCSYYIRRLSTQGLLVAIPPFQKFFRPLLELHVDGDEVRRPAVVQAMISKFDISVEEAEELLPSGTQRRFDNRIAWALSHMVQAGLLTRPSRGVTKITAVGKELLVHHSGPIDISVLNQYPEYVAFRQGSSGNGGTIPTDATSTDQTPEEAIESAFGALNESLAGDLLDRLLQTSPEQFEQIVIDVLVAMGYGGTRREAGQRLGRSGDGGIDGAIREDSLGLDVIYLQAKRWSLDRNVSRPDVQAFVGALEGARARKGVFLTTTRFSTEAREYANSVSVRVVLIDGHELTRLMIQHNVGVTTRYSYSIKKLSEEFFSGDDD